MSNFMTPKDLKELGAPKSPEKKKRSEVPVRVFVGGGQKYWGPTSQRDEAITKKIPEILHRFAPEVEIVTGGMPGIADIFAKEWKGSCLDIVSSEYAMEYDMRNTGRQFQIIGESQEKRRLAVTNLKGIACALFIQGGKYSTHEIKLFQEKGIPIVTLYGGGGASGGMCPYKGWSYTPHESVLRSIVSSKDPNENVFNIANVLTGYILHNISGEIADIRGDSGETKKLKMDLTSSMCGILNSDEIEEEEEQVTTPHLVDLGEAGEEEQARILSAMEAPDPSGPTKVLFSIDIESRGDNVIEHGVLSIGYCVGLIDRPEVLAKGRISLKPLQYIDQGDVNILDEVFAATRSKLLSEHPANPSPASELPSLVKTQHFEERCLDEFWLNEEKNPGGKEKMQLMVEEGVDPIEGIRQFRAILDHYDDGEVFKAHVLSDNVVFDAGWLNYYLYKAGCPDLSHTAKGRYRRIFDMVDYRRGVCHMDHADTWMNEKAIIEHFRLDVNPDDHTHMPDEDAEYIYQFYVRLMNLVRTKDPVHFPREGHSPIPDSGVGLGSRTT